MDIQIQHDKTAKKFFTIVDGKEALMEYEIISPKILDYNHTFVPPELRGKKLAEKIVISALNYARDNNYKIIPTCSFVKRILSRHPEYQQLVAKS